MKKSLISRYSTFIFLGLFLCTQSTYAQLEVLSAYPNISLNNLTELLANEDVTSGDLQHDSNVTGIDFSNASLLQVTQAVTELNTDWGYVVYDMGLYSPTKELNQEGEDIIQKVYDDLSTNHDKFLLNVYYLTSTVGMIKYTTRIKYGTSSVENSMSETKKNTIVLECADTANLYKIQHISLDELYNGTARSVERLLFHLNKNTYTIKIYDKEYVDGETVYLLKSANEDVTPAFINNLNNGQEESPVGWDLDGTNITTISLENHSAESDGLPLIATHNNINIEVKVVIVELQLAEVHFQGDGYKGEVLYTAGSIIFIINEDGSYSQSFNQDLGQYNLHPEDVLKPHWSKTGDIVERAMPFVAVAKSTELVIIPYFNTIPEITSEAEADLPFAKVKCEINGFSQSIIKEQTYLKFDSQKKKYYLENSLLKFTLSSDVKIINDFNIDWELKVSESLNPTSGGVWSSMGNTSHGKLFQTFKKSYFDGTLAYGYYFGCNKIENDQSGFGQNITTDQDFINFIWKEFEDRELYKKEFDPTKEISTYPDPLRYHYTPAEQVDNMTIISNDDENGNGECRAFARLFSSILQSHGILNVSNYTIVTDESSPNPNNYLIPSQFIVKNWDFIGQNHDVGEAPFSHLNIPTIYDPTNPTAGEMPKKTNSTTGNNEYDWFNYEVEDKIGIEAQGFNQANNNNAWSSFGRHVVVKVGNFYYDPSYGKKYTSIDDVGDDTSFAEQAVIGYYKQILRTFNEYNIGNINGDKDVNGEDILESDLQWTVFLFVKRSVWEDIKFK